ncbi:Ldh family oxidoreductase [Mycobacterium sp. 1274761.0]|uniref:Ldh family oxidoreductase n=1 Tax=Mycobacterium sp. 1274761.0 TaxID=1834077 RepID=UPI0009ECE43E|nr:Ldh family oxidoreductase [Mycobacterium sp. 1274761.0]
MTSSPIPQLHGVVIVDQVARSLTRLALTDAGMHPRQAADVADALVDTSLRGIDTHGLRLLPQYLDELATGVANAKPEIQVVRDRGAGIMLDADGALGVHAGLTAARHAESRARAYGVAAVGVRNSNHFGAASVYTRRLARHGLVGIAVTSAASRVAPFGGVEPLFGTNPISVAAATDDDEFALDMATSQVCFGQVKHRRSQGIPLETGWVTDDAGSVTTDPDEAYALSPLGGYKGQGLAMAVTLLGSVLTGTPPDWQLAQVGEGTPGRSRGVGHLVLALDPIAFAGSADFATGLAGMLSTVRAAAPAEPDEPVLCPGDPQRAHERGRRRDGITLDARTGKILADVAARHNLAGPVVTSTTKAAAS